ncbi:hypothetical protein ACFWBM_09365 [Streptomyces sp. NPDC059980]|uniref:hypothetical protein n=1 Tax=Streptomyces sp. NPDC059980 TaxID=3347022 RepID=UPI0036986B82
MSGIEDILSRALLVRGRSVPRDIVNPTAPAEHPNPPDTDTDILATAPPVAAAEDLRALCETVVTHTPANAVADFVTDQIPEPRSALVLACVLQLADTDEGARFWWQYAAGAGQAAAAYCLYLHHLALGEKDTADWWHRQADDVQPAPEPHNRHTSTHDLRPWNPSDYRITSTSTTTILRVLRHLAKYSVHPRSATVTELMDYVPTAVASGYLREPEMDLPMPGPAFATRITALLEAAADRPDISDTLPARPDREERAQYEGDHPATDISAAALTKPGGLAKEVGETARR